MRTVIKRRRAAAAIAASLSIVLAVDMFGMGPVSADPPESGDLSRSERVDAVVEGLNLDTAVDATNVTGSWDALPGSDALSGLPVDLPAEDEEVVALTEQGIAPVAYRLKAEEESPNEVDLGGIAVSVAAADAELVPDAVLLRVAGEAETEAAGVTGVLLKVTDASEQAVEGASVELTVSYAEFAGLVGGDWASRLRIMWIPDCGVGAVDCRQFPLETVNDVAAQTVTAIVPVEEGEPATYALDKHARSRASGSGSGGSLAVTAGASGSGGNWGATSLSPSSTWGAGGATGGFTWSLPFSAPAAAAGPAPELGLSYSSAVSDGRTPSSNNQSGLVGEGFDLSTGGFVERTYTPCGDDVEGSANNAQLISADLCWGTENATLNFNGSSVELIRDATSGTWRAKHDDGSRIERLTGAYNGGEANEYWKVTTADGIQYFFGRGQRTPTDTTALNSAWTVPVYGNHPDEPCYHADFSDSRCNQVWRWNLEYVVDPLGNSMTYFYTKETNNYVYDLMGNFEGHIASYTSGGRLDRIEYGTRAGSESTTTAPAKVTFTTSPRCITNLATPDSWCDSTQTSTASNKWLDTPVDLVCTAEPCTNIAPAFFDRYRLSKMSTFAFDGSTYKPVDSWSIQQRFVGSGTSGLEHAASPMLVTTSITHTGHAGTTNTGDDITLPPNQFGYTFLDNRVSSTADGVDPIRRPRVTEILTESGASVSVNYRTECTAADQPGTSEAAQSANTRLCYPVKWAESQYADAVVEYFHKYVVDSIVESGAPPSATGPGLITGSLAKETSFTYTGGAFWAKPTGAMVKAKEMTYSEFRGFAEVTTTEGVGTESSASTSRYFRGTGQQLVAGPVGHTVTVTDDLLYQGQIFAGIELNGSTKVFETVTVPGEPIPVATNTAGVKATRIPSTTSYGFSYTASGDLQYETKTVTTTNAYGQVISAEDLGDVDSTSDDQCTTVTYAHETNAAFVASYQVSLPVLTETASKACGQTVVRPDDLLSSDRATYDDKGRSLESESLDPADGSQYVLMSAVLEYDTWGRPLKFQDALGRVSTVSYQHSAGGLMQSMTSSTPDPDGAGPLLPFQTTTTFNPLTGMVISTTDLNGRVTSGTYDALGRLLTATYPQHQGMGTPSVAYEYTLAANGLNSVVTKTLGADGVTQHASATLYDGLLRPFQTQVEGVDAGADHNADAAARGRMIAHVYYDSAGRVSKQTGQWLATGVPSGTPVDPIPVPPSMTTFVYDSAGRQVEQIFSVGTDSNTVNQLWSTVTDYRGATTVQVPPLGGTPVAVTTDARGRTVEMREYVRDPDTDSAVVDVADVLSLPFQSTTYAYDASDQRTEMRDAEDNIWSYEYDFGGRLVGASDPDGGSSASTFDLLGRIVTHTDANGETLAYTYDALGRTVTLRDDSPSGNVRVQWAYDEATYPDNTRALGQMSSATRFVDGQQYTTSVPRYDLANRPLATTVTLPDIPAFEQLDSHSFATGISYTSDGQIASIALPGVRAAGAAILGGEVVTTQYDSASMPSWMSAGFGWGTYVAESRFTADGRPLIADLGNTYGAITSYQYESGTNRLVGVSLDREGITGSDVAISYGYDAAGNITSMSDRPTATALAGAQHQDNQCFGYDGLRRLEVAWTPGDGNCAVAQDAIQSSDLGGVEPYWTEYEYDPLGNRTLLTEHGAGAADTATTSYEHGAGGAGPHQVTQTSRTLGSTTTVTEFEYDDRGNRVSASSGGDSAGYVWDAEGELTAVGNDEYIYDASGNRLVRIDASGTTVYLPGGQEIQISGSTVSASRYYSFAGTTVAMRTGSGLGAVTSLVSDRHGSTVAAVPNTVWEPTSVVRMFSDPFGAVRGGSDAGVPGDHRFLGAVFDAGAGLSLLGARYYDAVLGTFISVDPQLNPSNPAQFNAYVYSGNNPLTWSDPSGLDWWSDMVNAGKKALNAVGSFVNKYKSEIVGAVVGIAVGVGCTVATGGAGVVGCAILGGMAGGAVTSLMKSAETGQFSVGGLITDTLVGGAIGGLTAGLGVVLGPVLKAGAAWAGNAIKTGLSSLVRTVTSKVQPLVNSISNRVQNFFRPAGIKPPGAARLPQDVGVNPKAPPAMSTARPVGSSPTQNAHVQSRIADLQADGATNIRVNQQQVNIDGVRVGVNRPDLQYTLNNQRIYEEFDIPSSLRGAVHEARISANDPMGIVNLFRVS